jgi:hypothetical protein
VSVELDAGLIGDISSSYPGFPHASNDEKPLDDYFLFESFPEGASQQLPSLVQQPEDDSSFFASSFGDPHASPFDLSDAHDAPFFDMQTATGATTVSDGCFAAEI